MWPLLLANSKRYTETYTHTHVPVRFIVIIRDADDDDDCGNIMRAARSPILNAGRSIEFKNYSLSGNLFHTIGLYFIVANVVVVVVVVVACFGSMTFNMLNVKAYETKRV